MMNLIRLHTLLLVVLLACAADAADNAADTAATAATADTAANAANAASTADTADTAANTEPRAVTFKTRTMGTTASLILVTADSAAVADLAYEALVSAHQSSGRNPNRGPGSRGESGAHRCPRGGRCQ